MEKEISVNGNPVSYFEEGLPEALPVIFIHGFPFSKSMWMRQLDALKNKYRPIAYDVRGHGKSGAGKTDFSISLFADDLLAFMDVLKIEKAVVCGLSMGGYIALNAIQKQPDRFAGLILADTQCGADTPEGREKRMKTIAFIRKNGLDVYAEESLKNLFAPASFQSRQEEVKFIRKTILGTPDEAICRTLQALADREESCSCLAKIKAPVCVVVGSEDKITPIQAAQKMADAIPGAKLVIIEKAGHLTNLEMPGAFNDQVLKFLDDVRQNQLKK
ncbi:MAG: alpha/beta fold hydrolase [Cyclobacteriaceae bacterium]|nr:alpha/beta fold hydrolase [Cyclobacteriaceae bacterium]